MKNDSIGSLSEHIDNLLKAGYREITLKPGQDEGYYEVHAKWVSPVGRYRTLTPYSPTWYTGLICRDVFEPNLLYFYFDPAF